MGLFGMFDPRVNDEDDVYDADETDELLEDSELYFAAVPLESTVVSVTPKDIYHFDTGGWLEYLETLPYEFRCYFDTRRAFAKAYDICREEITDFVTYEGGRSADYSESFGYDDHTVSIVFSMSRDSDRSPYVFTADIKIDE